MTVTYTPPQIAKRYAVNPDKVLAWIRSGELTAVNVATSSSGRPRWRITAAALAEIEGRRSSRPAAKPATRRRREPSLACEEYV